MRDLGFVTLFPLIERFIEIFWLRASILVSVFTHFPPKKKTSELVGVFAKPILYVILKSRQRVEKV